VPWLCWQGDLEPEAGEMFEPGVAEQEHIEDQPLVFVREVGMFDAGRDPALLGGVELAGQDLAAAFGFEEQVALALDQVRAWQACELLLDAGA